MNSTGYKVPFIRLLYVSILLNSIAIITVVYLRKSLPPQVPLFYGLPEGDDQLTRSVNLLIAPIISFSIVGINLLLSLILKNDLLKKTLVTAGFFVSLFSFITLVQIFFLIGPL